MTTALAVDIGGTKLLCALIEDGRVLNHVVAETIHEGGPEVWLDTAAKLAAPWAGQFIGVGMAVTGAVDDQGCATGG